MKSLKVRLSFVIFFALAAAGALGYLTFKTYHQYVLNNHQFATSEELVRMVGGLKTHRLHQDDYDQLQKIQITLQPQARKTALAEVLAAYADKNRRQLKSSVHFFVHNEGHYRQYLLSISHYLEYKIRYLAVLCLVMAVAALLIVYAFLLRAVFNPLAQLSQKMIDFLNDKYTYKYTVPAPNEVGHLHATFNELAQRVLTNMEELKALDVAKSEFLNIASHELRTPLTSVKGSIGLLKSGVGGALNDSSLALMNIAETETDRLIRLINDLLDLAKIEAKKLPMQLAWYSLNDLIQKTTASMLAFAKTAGVHLCCEPFASVEVYMDKDRVQQVLTNLLSNAVKYSPKDSTINLQVQLNGSGLEIDVCDQGKGIAPEDQALIFERFRQATGPDNPLVKGTGLGLAIAKALVDEHHGQIGVRSKPGEGSVFYFTLPEWRQPLSRSQQRMEVKGA